MTKIILTYVCVIAGGVLASNGLILYGVALTLVALASFAWDASKEN